MKVKPELSPADLRKIGKAIRKGATGTELNKPHRTVLMGPIIASEPHGNEGERLLREAWRLRFSVQGGTVSVSRVQGVQVAFREQADSEDGWSWRQRPAYQTLERFELGPWLPVLRKLLDVGGGQ